MYATSDGTAVLVASHRGLRDYASGSPDARPAPDLEALAGSPGPVLYASGHAGPDTPAAAEPGLLASADGGRSWTPAPNGGHDFKALARTRDGLLGFEDGQLWLSRDTVSWERRGRLAPPASLSGTPATDAVLATAFGRLQRSADGGLSWAEVPGAPPLELVALASATSAAGLGLDGSVYTSQDAGQTWQQAGRVDGQPRAFTAVQGPDGALQVWAATEAGVLVSLDGARSFGPYTRPGAQR